MPEALLEDENADDLLSRPTESEIGQQISAGTLDNFAVVEVRNSSRPLAPDIVYVVPTLGKVVPQTSQVPGGETTVTRRRFGNGLRVFLRRPWFSSGAGELLAVVIQNMDEMASTPPVPPPYVTEWANDPIVNASTVPLVVRPDNFRATAGEPTKVKLDELDRSVTVVGYEVEFDPDRGLWFADIEFTGLDSYMPMVRLALARFQPKSVDDTHISRVVRTDYVQPLPDRTLTISRPSDSPGPLTVTLTGIEPEVTGAKPLVRVWIEVLAKPGQGELGWEEMAITPQVSATPADLWRGIFDLASASLQSGRRYRLVIQESAPVSAVSGATAAEARLDRIVYADTWDIPTDN
jgi:hypothetical protein